MKRIAFILLFAIIASGTLTLFQKPLYTAALSDQLTAYAVVLMDARTGRVLYYKNQHTLVEPASTTKIMTCLLALEHLPLDKVVTIDAESPFTGGSRIALVEGERLTVEDLLLALMLNSANDAAVALAIAIAGSVENFSVMMNNRAREIGALRPSYQNPTGLHGPEHLATAYDLAVVSMEAMRNPEFRRIVGTVTHDIMSPDGSSVRAYLRNTNRMLHDETTRIPVRGVMTPPLFYGATGIKTGFTPQAGGTLAASAERGGTELIAVVLGSTVDARFSDSIKLLEFGFENFFTHRAVDSNALVEAAPVMRGVFNRVPVKVREDKYITLPIHASVALVSTEVVMDENITAPVEAGQILGRVDVFEGVTLVGAVPVVAAASIEQGMFLSRFGVEDSTSLLIIRYLVIIGSVSAALVILYFALLFRYRLKRKARIKELAMQIALERQERQKDLDKRQWPYRD